MAGPVQMTLGRGALYVTEATGKLTRIDLAGGTRRTFADKLPISMPSGPACRRPMW